MPYIIDGHNLIPKIPSMSLHDVDDETRLIEMLQVFCHRKRKQVEVFFDQAPIGQARARNYGAVVARFVRQDNTADQAIQKRLSQLGRAARNWIVISSDHTVQAFAHAVKAKVISSEKFANILITTITKDSASLNIQEDKTLSEIEIAEWLDLFNQKTKE